jgi:hypothetical protein
MLLGEIIAKIQDPSFAEEGLMELDDLPLMCSITEAAAEEGLPASEFAGREIGRFIYNATDEDWLTLVGLMSRADNPGRTFLHHVLSKAVLNCPPKCDD